MAAGYVVTLFDSALGSDDVIFLDLRALYLSLILLLFLTPVSVLVSAVCCGLLARAVYLVSPISYLSVTFPNISSLDSKLFK